MLFVKLTWAVSEIISPLSVRGAVMTKTKTPSTGGMFGNGFLEESVLNGLH